MKKIFAIALALVMVLSMASAFAMTCTAGYDWNCATTTTKCGKGAIEVIPYVKVNNACGGTDWQLSECASAINDDDVFYAVKLTVDANASDEWWNAAAASLTFKGMASNVPATFALSLKWKDLKKAIATEETEDEANTFYYDFAASGWDIVNDNFEFDVTGKHVDNVPVEKASKAKVCAKLTSEFDLDDMMGIKGKKVDVSDWGVSYYKESGDEKGDYLAFDFYKNGTWEKKGVYVYLDNDSDKVVKVMVQYNDKNYWYVGLDSNGLLKRDGGYETTTCAPGKLVVDVFNYFGFGFGTCITEKAIAANFGWDDKVEDCFAWGDKAPAVVDAECVVAIPKTGDASVLAWLF